MDEFFKSVAESLRRRATTALLGTYTIFWAVLHWEGIYTTLFVSQDYIFKKYGMLKNEYVEEYFFGFKGIDDWNYYLRIIIPLALTFLFIWVLPKYVFIHAFVKEREYKLDKQKIVLRDNIKLEKVKADLATESVKTLSAEKEVVEKQQEIIELDPTKSLEAEFEQFEKEAPVNSLHSIIDAIYAHNGNTERYYAGNRWVEFSVPRSDLARAHSNGLVNIDSKTGKIELTEKGKYFVSKSI